MHEFAEADSLALTNKKWHRETGAICELRVVSSGKELQGQSGP